MVLPLPGRGGACSSRSFGESPAIPVGTGVLDCPLRENSHSPKSLPLEGKVSADRLTDEVSLLGYVQ